MREHRAKLSRRDLVAKALDYLLTRWTAFTGFFEVERSVSATMQPSVR
jgi:hypothetical protein